MDFCQAMRERHSVRSYTDRAIDGTIKEKLLSFLKQCNEESGLHMQLVLDEPKAFDGWIAHYGKFSGVKNYIAVVGPKSGDLEEKSGYYGEKAVLYAQTLGLNTCWVALTYRKGKVRFQLDQGEKLCLVISIGYGTTGGVPHRSKPREAVIERKGKEAPPEWFLKGIDAALLAPTAMNQQKFVFSWDGDAVSAKAGVGFYTKIDLGIVKNHFEIGAGKDCFRWK